MDRFEELYGNFISLIQPYYDHFYIKYSIVSLLLMAVYRLGFQRKLPILKQLLVYIFLVIGALPLVILAYGLPIVPGLLVALALLITVRIRQKSYKPGSENKRGEHSEIK